MLIARKNNPGGGEKTTVYITRDTKRKLESYCREKGISLSFFLSELVKQYFETGRLEPEKIAKEV